MHPTATVSALGYTLEDVVTLALATCIHRAFVTISRLFQSLNFVEEGFVDDGRVVVFDKGIRRGAPIVILIKLQNTNDSNVLQVESHRAVLPIR
jgi:hypothetical protein